MITILEGGMLTTIQDLGRVGWQQYGVTVSGAMDILSHRVANILVGNNEQEGTLEITLTGPVLIFNQPTLIALCGGQFTATLNEFLLPQWKPVYVPSGSRLVIGQCIKGCRGYLSVAGGFNVPVIQQSKSTFITAKLGGFYGRALTGGETINTGPLSSLGQRILKHLSRYNCPWTACFTLNPAESLSTDITIRAIPGEHYQWLSKTSKQRLLHEPFIITPESNRMGYRLQAPSLTLDYQQPLLSDTVTCGTIQLPSSTEAIALMADRQTCGGYPKILQIINADIPLLAQCLPHTRFTIEIISFPDAEKQLLLLEQKIYKLKSGIYYRYTL